MTQTDDRADLREIRANVQKLDGELDAVRMSLKDLANAVTNGQADSKRAHEATAKTLLEMGVKLAQHVEPSLIGTIAQACSNPKVLGQVLVLLSTVCGLVAGTGYATARVTEPVTVAVPVMVPVPIEAPPVIPPGELVPHIYEEDTDHASIP